MSTPIRRDGLDRRTLLTGMVATGLLAACGGGGGSDTVAFGTYTTLQRFSPVGFFPGEQRLPFALADDTANFVSDGPKELAARITDLDGNPIGEPISAIRRDTTPSSYYAFRATVDTPGFYNIVLEGGPESGASFEVTDPSRATVPKPGDVLAGFDTPTPDQPGGVDPICTRTPPCDFHSTTLTDALAQGKPVAYFIGTPALCQTGTCTPTLESLVGVSPDYADRLVVVHAEVYTDSTGVDLTPAVDALGLAYEPTLILTDAGGVIRDRLDILFDESELRERLDVLLA